MKLKELLSLISNIATDKGLSEPFICGGTPRDKIMNRTDQMVDLDVTTGDEGSHFLAKELSLAVPGSHYKTMQDGHGQVLIGDFKVDFSSNFKVPGIEKMLKQAGLPNPTPMQCELYSRDFTCNSLLLSMDLKTIQDPTGLGINDISRKVIRTCLPAGITLGLDHKRIVRIIYLSAKLDFEIDSEIVKWVNKNPSTLIDCKPKYLVNKLQKAVDFNLPKTVDLLDLLGLWKYIPPLPGLIPYMNKPGRI